MGKIESFEIAFDHEHAVFEAGRTVKGTLTAKFKEAIEVRKIQLTIIGECKVRWYERIGKQNLQCKGDEIYINAGLIFCGHQSGKEITTVSEGVHTYPFELRAPSELPSSFEHAHGYVRYFCRALIDRPGLARNKKAFAYFTIVRHLDLNHVSADMRLASVGEATSPVVCCLCFCRADVQARFRINRKSFVPGEKLVIEAVVENNSGFTVGYSRVTIYQTVKFRGAMPWNFSSSGAEMVTTKVRVIEKKKHGPVRSHQSDTWAEETIVIPPLPPSDLLGCNYIDISYSVQFKVKVPHGKSIIINSPLAIGTIPLRTETRRNDRYGPLIRQPEAASPFQQPSAPPPDQWVPPYARQDFATAVTPDDVSMEIGSPPSYQECVFGKRQVSQEDEEDQGTSETQNYAPVYPFYSSDVAYV